jgi:hypothetical protein
LEWFHKLDQPEQAKLVDFMNKKTLRYGGFVSEVQSAMLTTFGVTNSHSQDLYDYFGQSSSNITVTYFKP